MSANESHRPEVKHYAGSTSATLTRRHRLSSPFGYVHTLKLNEAGASAQKPLTDTVLAVDADSSRLLLHAHRGRETAAYQSGAVSLKEPARMRRWWWVVAVVLVFAASAYVQWRTVSRRQSPASCAAVAADPKVEAGNRDGITEGSTNETRSVPGATRCYRQ